MNEPTESGFLLIHPPDGDPSSRALSSVSRREVTLFALILCALVVLRLAQLGGPQVKNDSIQYLSVTESLQSNLRMETSIVHFDPERSYGTVPAPITHFPPGYPLLTWSLSWLPFRLEWVAVGISLIGAVAILLLLDTMGRALGLERLALLLVLSLWVFSVNTVNFATSALTEMIFTSLVVASLASLVVLPRARLPARRVHLILTAAILIALAVWMRYAGLFFLGALHVVAALDMSGKKRHRRPWILGLLLADLITGVLLARNLWLTGSWQGGSTRHTFKGLGIVAHDLAGGLLHLVAGGTVSVAAFSVFVLSVIAASTIVLAVLARREAGSRFRATADRDQVIPLIAYFVIYLGGASYAGLTTDIDLSPRILFPLVPLALLSVGLIVNGTLPKATVAMPIGRLAGFGVVAVIVSFVFMNALSLKNDVPEQTIDIVTSSLELPTSEGTTMAAWIDENIPVDSVILATRGQATGYVLRRRTISTIGRRFSDMEWDECDTYRTMTDYKARWLILSNTAVRTGQGNDLDSEFFRRLILGDRPPWLVTAAENEELKVFMTAGTSGTSPQPEDSC